MPDLSVQAQDYLQTIWKLQEWSSEPVTPSALAQRSGMRRSTVSDALKRLGERGLVEHAPYGAVTLTDAGRAEAVRLVRRHRILETYLVEALGYGWDEVHDEADRLEHAASDELVARMEALLDHPEHDPHGDPIPPEQGPASTDTAETASAVSDAASAENLASTAPSLVGSQARVTVARVSDDNPELLRWFAERGIVPGAVLAVSSADAEQVAVAVDPPVGGAARAELVTLDVDSAAALWVAP